MCADALDPLVRLERRFTALTYCGIIDRTFLPNVLDGPFRDGCYMLQHDRSPIHMTHAVSSLLENRAVRVLDWPPNGADLNPIENVRGLMKKPLSKRYIVIATPNQLEDAVSEEWERLRAVPNITSPFYCSMPERVADVVAVNDSFMGS